MKKEVVTLEQTAGVSFEFHFDKGDLVIDQCEGISPEEGIGMFPSWALDAMREKSRA